MEWTASALKHLAGMWFLCSAQGGACRFAKTWKANRLKPHLPWPSMVGLAKRETTKSAETSKFAFWSIYKSETDARLTRLVHTPVSYTHLTLPTKA